jgi:hypothetical protein
MESVLLQYGAIGVLALAALMSARVMFNRLNEVYKLERERADRLEAELSKLNATVRDEYIQTLSKATRAIADALAAVRRE